MAELAVAPSASTSTPMSSPAVSPPSFTPDAAKLSKLSKRMTNRWMLRGFMLAKLPLGFIAGLNVHHLDRHRCEVSVPYGWLTQNPFRSTYFAAQAMAAEMSTGALGMLAVESAPASVAMLIVDMEGSFGKKATQTSTFTCTQGDEIFAAVAQTLATGEAATARTETVGRMPDGAEVSRFTFEWSFKKRSRG
ncbi:MAG: DUF4442 domain-containing protein [Acidobacteriota bacterium]